jgi:hypothetical protein|tara:strand:+ start:428 stop:940 length:513 start_codon:yes stop_codon:yes gene_type:complete
MKHNVSVIDNFLDTYHFRSIQRMMMSDRFPWFTDPNGGVGYYKGGDGMYFAHHFYHYKAPDPNAFLQLIQPLLYKIPYDQSALARAKGNMYPSMKRRVYHDWHTDFLNPHKGAIFCINTNNGFTCFKNKKIKSVENRLILFDPSIPHRATTCTDQTCRVNINFNYYVTDN